MPDLSQIKRPVAQEMKVFEKRFKEAMHSDVKLLNIFTAFILRNKGKQMRPLFVLLSAKLVGEVTDSTYTAASLIELMHTATLIHDDVVDESYERRSKFSFNALWRSKLAVLFGDYLLARGLLLASNKKDHDLLDLVAATVKEMSEGELLQLQKSLKPNINLDSYYEVIRKKTATLIATCTASGAKSAGASQEVIDRMYEIGINIGIAFQIKDDLFDYQPRGGIGKPTAHDLKEKKFTLPLLYALSSAPKTERRATLKLIRNGSMSSEKISQVIDFVKSRGGLSYAEEKMNEYKSKAESLLYDFPESESRTALLDLIRFTVERSK